jgi:hypothetical protein
MVNPISLSLPLCNNDTCDIYLYIHFVIICDVLLWRTDEMHLVLSLKSGCDRKTLRGQLLQRLRIEGKEN